MTTTVIEMEQTAPHVSGTIGLDQTFRKTQFINSLLTGTGDNFAGVNPMSNTNLNLNVSVNHRSNGLLLNVGGGTLLSTRKRSTVVKPLEKPFA